MNPLIEIVEVGPRDGLQNEKALLETPDKALAMADAADAATANARTLALFKQALV